MCTNMQYIYIYIYVCVCVCVGQSVTHIKVAHEYVTERVRGKYGRDVPITIIYEDRPTADFNSLFLALSGLYIHTELHMQSLLSHVEAQEGRAKSVLQTFVPANLN